MERTVYLKPPKEAYVKEGIIWKLKRCLYCLNDAARQFYQSVVDCLKNVGCKQSQVFEEKVMSKLKKRSIAGKIEENIFYYVCFDIKQDKRGIIMDQSKYISDIEGGKNLSQ